MFFVSCDMHLDYKKSFWELSKSLIELESELKEQLIHTEDILEEVLKEHVPSSELRDYYRRKAYLKTKL